MHTSIRGLSLVQAEAAVRELALAYAKTNRIEGELLQVGPDDFETERWGKVPVHWIAAFESVHRGVTFDGPSIFRVNLETGFVAPNESA